ncbi:lipase 3-like [Zootermopsis nevadensis]|uniref:Lipase 3 n=1 Tax=Zootermopsis nevadensis TaxID=136037 RepID=A0A067R0G5_ZOONE|nr:lipase 3-like [Zootermopsis nevadensis]KDR15393.1 Lipase 3 [Zootermopsis nevadensis]
MVMKNGYPVETHTVTTEDGYVLSIHRIPFSPKNDNKEEFRPAVFLQHGFLCSSFDWVVLGPGRALAYLLADKGYDVWIGNSRGNVYSSKHQTLTSKQKLFWNFSWHEMGVYDLPAVIDYVLASTSQKDLYYIGHSMGNTMFFVLTSLKPEYNKKIHLMVALAPVVFMSYVKSELTKLAVYSRTGEEADRIYNSPYFTPTKTWTEGVQLACRKGSVIQGLCSSLIFMIGGFNPQQLDPELLVLILSHYPAGSSTKAWVHYGQLMRTGKFQQYDHGETLNLKYYETPTPPQYNLSAVVAPVRLYNGKNDWLSSIEDTKELYSKLPNTAGMYQVKLEAFNHVDFQWAKDANTLVYNEVIGFIKNF